MPDAPRRRGRPVLTAAEPTRRITITLPASLVAYLERIGKGKRSRGARVAIEFHREKHPDN